MYLRRFFFLFVFLVGLPALGTGQSSPPVLAPADFPTLETVLDQMRATFSNQREHVSRKIERLGVESRTVRVRTFISLQGNLNSFESIVRDAPHYRDWMFRDINKRANGGGYLVWFLDILARPEAPGEMLLKYKINLPFMGEKERNFKFDPMRSGDFFVLSVETRQAEDPVLQQGRGRLVAHASEKVPGYLWVVVEAMAQLKKKFLYEAFPENILNTEAGDRIHKVLMNYQNEEGRRDESRSRRK